LNLASDKQTNIVHQDVTRTHL